MTLPGATEQLSGYQNKDYRFNDYGVIWKSVLDLFVVYP